MSIKIMSLVWDDGPADKAEILVLLAIADYCNDEGECWPAMASIARKARMTERGVQKICSRLCDIGWLDIDLRKGRRGCNLYRIKTPNKVHPEPRSPRTTGRETPNPVPKNPEPRSPEPSKNHQEPSLSKETRTVEDFLCQWASREAVNSFVAYRKKMKKALTLTAAKRQANQLELIYKNGFDPSDALGMAEEKGWQSIQADWYFKSKDSGKSGNDFLDKFQEQLKGNDNDNGLFQAHSNDTKRIG